jgi:uncharacterized protein
MAHRRRVHSTSIAGLAVAAWLFACSAKSSAPAPAASPRTPAAALASPVEEGPPGRFAALHELPITSIRPEGWLRQYLVHQRNGLTGHLEHGGFPFNRKVWAGEKFTDDVSAEAWWPFEQTGYWIDGMMRTGLLLDDDFLVAKANESLDPVLAHPAPNGYLGPILTRTTGEMNRWIHVVLFRALMAEHSATGDARIPAALRAHYLAGDNNHAQVRDALNIELMLWTYARTGDRALLDLARQVYRDAEKLAAEWDIAAARMLQDRPVRDHGVTFNERMKLGAMLYAFTGDRTYLAPSVAAHRKLMKYHMLVSGVNVSSEVTEPVSTTETHETCNITDFTWSTGYLLMATGDAAYADAIERAAFNAAPGSTTSDFKAFQYFSSPNQVIATSRSFQRSGKAEMAYAPNAHTACCAGNVNRFMPNFIARMWMTDGRGALVAALHGPSQVRFRTREGRQVTVRSVTGYPFTDDIRFEIAADRPARFPLWLRVPGWARAARVLVNGRQVDRPAPASFAVVEREFAPGDVVTLELPSRIALEPGPNDTAAVVRGPLVYSLRIEEDWRVNRADKKSTRRFPAYDLRARSAWNYALAVSAGDVEAKARLVRRELSDSPWSLASAPLEIQLPARKVKTWAMLRSSNPMPLHWDILRDPVTGSVVDWTPYQGAKASGRFEFTPPVPDREVVSANLAAEIETVRLVPFGAAKLRTTYFPVAAKPRP